MDSENKENIQLDKKPRVRVEQLNLNASDEDSDKGEWAVVYEDSDTSISSSKHDIAQKTDKTDLENDNDKLQSNCDLAYTDDREMILCDDLQSDSNLKSFIELKDLHKFGLKIDEIEFASDSSDIDIIEEEKSYDLLNPGCDERSEMSISLSSVVSQYSSMSAIREHFLEQIALQEYAKQKHLWNENDPDLTEIVSNETNPNLTSKVPIRAYVHQRNAVLNGKLTLILVLSITAVVGLGIGHFIGWSNQWQYSHQLSMSQVIKLKQLQDDLLVCMRIQNEADFESNGFQHDVPFKEVCHRDSDYWKSRFETFFEENKGMMELFQRTQKRFHDSKEQFEYVTEKECVNKTTSEAFNKLELNFLVRQMEHLNMLQVLEQVKKSEKQVKYLREENEGLKKKLEEEEQDDEVIVQEWNHKVTQLQEQNQELVKSIVDDEEEDRKIIAKFQRQIKQLNADNDKLRLIISQLENQMHSFSIKDENEQKMKESLSEHTKHDKNDYLEKYTQIRDKINQLMIENQDMKANIGRYRWMDRNKGSQEEMDKKMEIFRGKFGILQKQLQLEQEESKRWRENFENLLLKFKKIESERKNDQTQSNSQKESNGQFESETISSKGQKFLNKFYSELKDKWETLNKKYQKKLSEAYGQFSTNFEKFETNEDIRKQGDRLVKFGQYLENVMENIQNYSEKLIERGRKSKVMSFLSDKLTDLSHIIENNFVFNGQAQKDEQMFDGNFQHQKNFRPSSKNNKHKSSKDVNDWSTRRAKARENHRKQQ